MCQTSRMGPLPHTLQGQTNADNESLQQITSAHRLRLQHRRRDFIPQGIDLTALPGRPTCPGEPIVRIPLITLNQVQKRVDPGTHGCVNLLSDVMSSSPIRIVGGVSSPLRIPQSQRFTGKEMRRRHITPRRRGKLGGGHHSILRQRASLGLRQEHQRDEAHQENRAHVAASIAESVDLL